MKRFVLGLALFVTAAGAFAQGAFTIRRPAEGALVREVVEVRIPRASIPATGFVGIWANGRLYEAVAPIAGVNIQGNDFVYKLDTKANNIADGPLKIEAVLYADVGNANRVLNRTSVNVRVDNRTSITPPSGNGFLLRYDLTPGREMTYQVEFKQSVQLLTQADQTLGRGNELGSDSERFRYRFTTVNSFVRPGGEREGVILMQPLTPKGKDSVFLTVSGATQAARYFDYNMAPLYMRINSTGREIFGAIPFYTGIDGAAGDASRLDLYALLPMPVLPSRAVRLGGPAFAGVVQQGDIQLENSQDILKFTQAQPARGTVEAIEYERGLRCVRIRNVLEVGNATQGLQRYEENYWFALDLGRVIRLDRTTTVTRRMELPPAGGSGGSGGGGGGGSDNAPSMAGASSVGGGRSVRPGEGFDDLGVTPGSLFQSRPGRGGQPGSGGDGREGDEAGGRDGRGGGGGLAPGGGNSGAGAGSGRRGRNRLVRQTFTYSMIAE